MNSDTAKTLNWQLSKRLGLDPSQPHTVNAQGECGCYSSWTREDRLLIWVEHDNGTVPASGYWQDLTDFISDVTKEGQPDSLDGVAEASIASSADEWVGDYCSIYMGGEAG